MARAKNYLHNRFDGGMTHNNRDTSDLTKSSFIAHLDIYRENHRAYVMPGFVSDNAYDGDASGLKQFGIKNFVNAFGQVFGLGTKADGTGSKLLQRDITESEWKIPVNTANQAEGSDNLTVHPFFYYDNTNADFYFPVLGTQTDVARIGASSNAFAGGYEIFDDWYSSTTSRYSYYVKSFDSKILLVKGGSTGVSLLGASTITENTKTTGIFPFTLASGDYTVGIFGVENAPRTSRAIIWDSASLLADQNIRLGSEDVFVAGFPNNMYCSVSIPSSNTDLEPNGKGFMTVRALNGESASVIYRLDAPSYDTIAIHDMNEYYYNSMLWYARIPTNAAGTTFREGIWAAGSGSLNSQFGVSMLMDTSSLGLVERAAQFGFSTYFAHNEDGSVSRLDDFETGTYDVPGYIETLFYGSDTPFDKSFSGISVVTEDLPSGGSVEVQYRFDENDAWTSLGTSSTVGTETHNFTKAAGAPIGKFREIQFKIILTGKITLKSYLVSIEETDSLPFKP